MNNRINDTITLTGRMRQIELAPATIFIHKFLAPLQRRESTKFIEAIEKLAEMFNLEHDGCDYINDTMHKGNLYSQWFIIVKGSKNGVDGFEREARRLGD